MARAMLARLKRTFKALCVVTAEEMVIAAVGEIVYQGMLPEALGY